MEKLWVPHMIVSIGLAALAVVLAWFVSARDAKLYKSVIWSFGFFLLVESVSRTLFLLADFPAQPLLSTVFIWFEVGAVSLALLMALRLVIKLRPLPSRGELEAVLEKLTGEVEHHKWTTSLLETKTQELLQSERAWGRRKILQSELRFSEVLAQITGLAIFEVDQNFKVCRWNWGAEDLLGYTSEEAEGKDIESFTHDPAWLDLEYGGSADHLNFPDEGEQRTIESWWYRKDGKRFWALASIRRVLFDMDLADPCGCEGHYFIIVRDMSDRMNISKELARESQRLRSVLNTIGDAVVVVDSAGRIQRWNKASEVSFGYSASEIRGCNVAQFFDPESAQFFRDLLDQYLRSSSEQVQVRPWDQLMAVRKNGDKFPVEIQAGQFSFEGETFCALVLRDMTEVKRAEENLREAKEAAEAANIAKSRFLAGISHELRTPLTVISGYTDLMSMRVDDVGYIQGKLGLIKRHCRLLLTIISDLLDLTKAEAGRLSVHNEPFELLDLLKQVNEMFHVLTGERSLVLDFRLNDFPTCWVRSDSVRIRQILSNLLSNAIKFSRTGGIIIVRPQVRPIANQNQFELSVEVEDNGLGISADWVNALFQPFVQLGDARSPRFGGTGLGLVVSRRLARLLGGDVELLHTEEGKGSVFRATFVMESLTQKEIANLERVEHQGPAAGGNRLRGHSILVVDDTEEILTLTSEILKFFGAQIFPAENGARALMVFEQHRDVIDLVLMDIRMPVMDGWEARKRLAALGCQAPIVALTANAMTDEVQSILDAGFDGYLSKPIEPTKLVNTIAQLVEKIRIIKSEPTKTPPTSRNLDQPLI